VARFIGDLVEVPGTKRGGLVHTALGDLAIHGDPGAPDGPVIAGIRPEQVQVDAVLEAHGDREGHRARVDDVAFFGHDTLAGLVLSSPDGVLSRVTARTAAPLQPGDEVSIRVIGPALAYAPR
jgi:hypothetical protein